jgi:ADP-heptose:LPS heptosyltransferase
MTDSRTIYILNRLGLNQNVIRAGLNKSQYSVYDLTVEKDFLKIHASERTKTLLQLIGLSEPNMNYDLHFGEKDLSVATTSLKDLDSSNKTLPFIILNPFAGARFRSFNFDSVKRLSTHIHQAFPNHRIIVTGSPNDSEFLLNCQKELSNSNVFYLPDVKSLSQLCALVSLADGVVTPDTSLVHIASAFDKNIIAFFRDDSLDSEQNSKQWAPISSNAQVILCTGKTNGYIDVNTFEDSTFKKALTSFLTGKSL